MRWNAVAAVTQRLRNITARNFSSGWVKGGWRERRQLLLLWLLHRVGYDRRALTAWTVLSAVLVLVCYDFTPPAGAQLTDPNTPVNFIYGFNNAQPQRWMNQRLHVVLWLAVLWLIAWFPMHLGLRHLFAQRSGIVNARLRV